MHLPPLPNHTRLAVTETETGARVTWPLYKRGPLSWIQLGLCLLYTAMWLSMLVPAVLLTPQMAEHPGAAIIFIPVLLALWLLFGFVVALFWSGLEFWGSERLVMSDRGLVFQRVEYPRLWPQVASWNVDHAEVGGDGASLHQHNTEIELHAPLSRADRQWLASALTSRSSAGHALAIYR